MHEYILRGIYPLPHLPFAKSYAWFGPDIDRWIHPKDILVTFNGFGIPLRELFTLFYSALSRTMMRFEWHVLSKIIPVVAGVYQMEMPGLININ